jgi:hypothetical protein
MSTASLIINVGTIEHIHGNGLSGTFYIPPRPDKQPFSLLVIYPTPEIQDIGDQRSTIHWIKARPLAKAIVGEGSDSPRAKYGVLLCAAEPDVPKELLKAIEDEIEYMKENPPEVKNIRKGNLMEAKNIYPPGGEEKRNAMSREIVRLRDQFHAYCRTLVTAQEIATAQNAMVTEYARLISDEGDRMWARPQEQVNITDLHRRACREMGQERPWCYVPKQLFDCPGCGQKIQENVITCGHCGAILDEPIAVLSAMPPNERARRLYPERYTEAAALTPSGGAQNRAQSNPRR